MRGESRVALFALAIGLAPVIIKKSKPFARYVGDHLIKAGEYIKHGMEDDPIKPGAQVQSEPAAETVAAHTPVSEPVVVVAPSPLAHEEPVEMPEDHSEPVTQLHVPNATEAPSSSSSDSEYEPELGESPKSESDVELGDNPPTDPS